MSNEPRNEFVINITTDGELVALALKELYPFSRHPYKVRDDDAMRDMAESVKQYGVLSPAIARTLPDGGYELVSGHRRKRACELAGLETMPVIVRELDDDAAAILVVDSNLQREGLLPSERAFAYKLKLEALRRQGERTDLTSRQLVGKLEAADTIGESTGESGRQIQRYIRLTELIPPLLDMVDERKIAFNPAYELSFLKQDEQRLLLDAMDSEQATPSLSQAQRLKQFSQRGELTAEVMRAIMSEEKKPEIDRITITALLHAEADGGDHHQAAGTVAEAQKARGGALIEYISLSRTVHETARLFCLEVIICTSTNLKMLTANTAPSGVTGNARRRAALGWRSA